MVAVAQRFGGGIVVVPVLQAELAQVVPALAGNQLVDVELEGDLGVCRRLTQMGVSPSAQKSAGTSSKNVVSC